MFYDLTVQEPLPERLSKVSTRSSIVFFREQTLEVPTVLLHPPNGVRGYVETYRLYLARSIRYARYLHYFPQRYGNEQPTGRRRKRRC